MNKLTNTNKPFDLVQTESLWDSCFTLLRPWLTFFSLYDWRNGLGNLIDSQDQKLPVSVCCGRKQTCRRHRVNVGSYQLDWQSRLTWCICLWLLWERICWTAAASPAKSSPVVQSGLEGHLWGLSTVHCMLCRYRQAKRTSLIFFFLCRKVHFSGIPLFLVFKWRLAIILLSLFLPPYSLSALLSFFLCYKLWGMRRERGKIKANPHTLPSNIIRLSLMALLEFLPCTCVWFCVHVQCYPCLFYAFACLSLSFSVYMCACTLTFGCTYSHYVQCFPLAWGPVLPLGRHAISPCILSKTSKLPFSEVHVGAAHCLMSLLFCWALS